MNWNKLNIEETFKELGTNQQGLSAIAAEEAVKAIKSGHRVFVHGSAATPLHLLKVLLKRSQSIFK